MSRPLIPRIAIVPLLAAMVASTPSQVSAGPVGDILKSLMRLGRRAEEGEFLRHIDDIHIPRASTRSEADLLKRFNRLENVDEGLRKEFQRLPIEKRALVIELGEAGQRVIRNHPKPEQLLLKLDADGLRHLQTYGDFVAEGVELMGPGYKEVVRQTGSGAGSFYTKYLRPHYKKLLAGGVVSAYLLAPDQFHDAAGNLTERATRELTKLGIEIGAAAHRGVSDGVRSKLTENPLSSGVGIAFMLCCLALLLPGVRWRVFRVVRPLLAPPMDAPQEPKRSTKPSRRFEE